MKRTAYIIAICFGCISAACQQTKGETEPDVTASFQKYKSRQVPQEAVQMLTQLSMDGGNSLEALNIRDFSKAMPHGVKVVPDAKIVGIEDTARGTDVAPAIIAAIAAASSGQFIVIGPGDWVVSTPIELPASKQVNLVCNGNLHFNKRDGFLIKQPVNKDPQHHLFFYGSLIGRENMPRHTRATYEAGTQPNWLNMTNTAVDITNCSRNFILINRAEGFGNAVRINGEKGNGAQENTISFQFFYKNANGITLRSVDGNSYVDKNYFMGFYGGAGRISGGLAVKIDGFDGPAPNGERFNGAFRSNEFHFLIEQVNNIIVANGDVTEPIFDITIEGGDNTGVFGTGFQMRSEAPNFVRSPKYCGSGVFSIKWLTGGLGIDGIIMGMPVYYNHSILLGTNGKTDRAGNIIMESRTPLSKTIIDKLPSNIKIVNTAEQ